MGTIFEIGSSKRVHKSDWTNIGIPFYRARDIEPLNGGLFKSNLFINFDFYQVIKEKYGIPKKGDILITGVGTTGKTYVIPDNNPFYYKDGNIICLNNVFDICSYYIRYCFLSKFVIGQVNKTEGTTVNTFTIINANKILIPLPPMQCQKQIVKHLDSIFRKTDELKMNQILLARYSDLLKRKLLGDIFYSSDKSHYKLLKEIGTIVGGGTPRTDNKEFWNNGSIPWIGPADMGRFKEKYITHVTRKITEKGLNNSGAELMPAGSVIMSSRAPIGYLGIATFSICTNQGCKSVVPNNMTDSEYIYYAIMSQIKDIQRTGNGTTFNEVSGKALGNVTIHWPSSKTREKKVNQVKSLFLMIDDLL